MIVKKLKIYAKPSDRENDVNTLLNYSSGKLNKKINVTILSLQVINYSHLHNLTGCNYSNYQTFYKTLGRIVVPKDGWMYLTQDVDGMSYYSSRNRTDTGYLVNSENFFNLFYANYNSYYRETYWEAIFKVKKGDIIYTGPSVWDQGRGKYYGTFFLSNLNSIPYGGVNNFILISNGMPSYFSITQAMANEKDWGTLHGYCWSTGGMRSDYQGNSFIPNNSYLINNIRVRMLGIGKLNKIKGVREYVNKLKNS